MKRRTGDKIEINGDYQYNAYYKGKTPQRFWHYNKLTEALKSLDIHDNDYVLDMGCGSGLIASFIAKNENVKVLAVDANEKAISFAKSKFKMSNLEFRCVLLDELYLQEDSIDKIIFLEVIEHLSENQSDNIFNFFYQLLKTGGKLVISTPNRKSLWPFIERVLDFFRMVPKLAGEQHEYLYTDYLLIQKAVNSGFFCINKKHINTLAPWFAPLNWDLALKINDWEVENIKKHGSILLYTFQKH
jgi:2-polyprenyl-3-methyl-5-hydroxy-6-metoxy-1,4-benzoquinol methylase